MSEHDKIAKKVFGEMSDFIIIMAKSQLKKQMGAAYSRLSPDQIRMLEVAAIKMADGMMNPALETYKKNAAVAQGSAADVIPESLGLLDRYFEMEKLTAAEFFLQSDGARRLARTGVQEQLKTNGSDQADKLLAAFDWIDEVAELYKKGTSGNGAD